MRTPTRRPNARRSHHPEVTCDHGGRWHWVCTCGAGVRGTAGPTDWRAVLIAALVHESATPGE